MPAAGWQDRCKRDRDWCRTLVHEAVITGNVRALFPSATIAPQSALPAQTIQELKKRCGSDTSCFDAVRVEIACVFQFEVRF